ncbi:MAG TPA: GntR family transcriptional regulator [Candidatus Elarobacter sp.]|jgi:DNA-binding GntR family transcriptional regulator|nr:GntR family transcriptional regulator [Candidatus Elarobacter sp.]
MTSGADRDATARLRDAITSGEFQPNQHLVEKDLVALLGTSRGSVRVVLARLEQEGLVVREHNRGARVRLVSESDAVEIVEARSALESVAARHAAINATDADVATLRAIIVELRALRACGDLLAYADKNRELHGTIIRMSRHHTAATLLGMLRSQSVSFQYRSILQPGRADRSIHEHEDLVEAIAAHDAPAAEAAMRAHLDEAVVALEASIASGRNARRR